jgi:hypothetical protein
LLERPLRLLQGVALAAQSEQIAVAWVRLPLLKKYCSAQPRHSLRQREWARPLHSA